MNKVMNKFNIKLKDVLEAQERLSQYLTPTPLVRNEWLSKKYNANVYLKLENMQPIGSFKLRGATNKLSTLTEDEKKKGVLAVSAGNHAQGVSWAAQKLGIEATIIMPTNSPLIKVQNTRALGAKVILKGDEIDQSFDFAKEYLKENPHVYIHPFCDPLVIAGQGTIGLELIDQLPSIDFVFGSIGGGGMIGGTGIVLKEKAPKCRVVGVQSSGANSMIQSLQKGYLIEGESVSTFADGIKVRIPREEMYHILDEVLDYSLDIDDSEIAKCLLILLERAAIMVEGACSISLAALDKMYHQDSKRFRGKNIVLMMTGGNIDINLVDRIIDRGLVESQRRIKMEVITEDRPGNLARLTKLLNSLGGNILDIQHIRDNLDLQLNQTIIVATVETNGEEHSKEILENIKKDFNVSKVFSGHQS